MSRVNVFLKDKLLDEINEEAKEEGTNRSALIQTALEKYIEAKRCGAERGKRRRGRDPKKMRWRRVGSGSQATIEFRDTNVKALVISCMHADM